MAKQLSTLRNTKSDFAIKNEAVSSLWGCSRDVIKLIHMSDKPTSMIGNFF